MRPALLLAVAAASAWPAASADAGAANLLANGGFEQLEADGTPSGWGLSWQNTHSNDSQRGVTKQRPDFAVDADVAHTGARSVRIGVRRPVDDGVLSYMTQVPADPAVAVYRASAWVRTQGLKGTTARMIAVSLGDRGKWLGADYTLLVADKDHDWTRYAAFFEPHKGARSIRIRLWVNFEYAGTGTAWFDDVAFEPTTLKEVPPARYADASPLPPLTAEDRRRGYLPFVRNVLETVYPASMPRPGERLAELRLTGFPGEDEGASVCVRAIEPIAEMTLSASALRGPEGSVIPAQNVRVQPVECLVRQGQSRWGRHADAKMLKPVYVAETSKTSVAKDTTRQLWITVSVPRDAPAGDYAGQVSLTTAKAAWSFPVAMRVYPFALPEVEGIALGMYGRLHEDDAFVDYVFADMRRHGMTTVGLCCPLGAEMEMAGGKVRVRFDGKSALERAMRAYIKAGFPEPVVWLMGSDVVRWCRKQGALESEAFGTAYKGVLEAILAKAGASKWPPIVFQPIDEPFEHTQRLATAKRCLQVMKTIPGLRTEEDGPNGNPRTLEELYGLSDVLAVARSPRALRRGRVGQVPRAGQSRRQGDLVLQHRPHGLPSRGDALGLRLRPVGWARRGRHRVGIHVLVPAAPGEAGVHQPQDDVLPLPEDRGPPGRPEHRLGGRPRGREGHQAAPSLLAHGRRGRGIGRPATPGPRQASQGSRRAPARAPALRQPQGPRRQGPLDRAVADPPRRGPRRQRRLQDGQRLVLRRLRPDAAPPRRRHRRHGSAPAAGEAAVIRALAHALALVALSASACLW